MYKGEEVLSLAQYVCKNWIGAPNPANIKLKITITTAIVKITKFRFVNDKTNSPIPEERINVISVTYKIDQKFAPCISV